MWIWIVTDQFGKFLSAYTEKPLHVQHLNVQRVYATKADGAL